MSVVVLGAGLAGLSAADVLASRGVGVHVIERESGPGGLAATVTDEGYHFDYGPHRFHTKKPELLERVQGLLGGLLLEMERRSRIRLLDRYFRYPLSLGDVLRRMPLHSGAGMILSYLGEKVRNLVSPRDEKDFEGWVLRRFGRRLYDIYFGPYTEKLWGCPPSSLSADWASQRITVPGLTSLLRETLFPREDSVRSLVGKFHYPRGGIGEIARAFVGRIGSAGGTFTWGTAPSSVARNGDGSFTVSAGGREHLADALVSTIPIPEYVRLLGGLLPDPVHRAAAELRFRALVFVTVRTSRRPDADDHWIYAPEGMYLFNRLSIPGNFDDELPVEGFQTVFEFSCDEGDWTWRGEADLAGNAVEGGARLGLFGPGDVTGSITRRRSHAYPIYDLGYGSRVARVLDALDAVPGSVTCGRQGLFRYNNMDHSIEMGELAAKEVLGEGSVRDRFDWTSDTWADG
jgi:protoporphyrinogen oxidase